MISMVRGPSKNIVRSFKMRNLSLSKGARWRSLLVAVSLLGLAACAGPDEKVKSYFERGESYLAKGDFAKAAIEYKNAIQIKKNHIESWRGLARIEERNRNWQGFAQILNTIVELDANDVTAKVSLARLVLMGGDLERALTLVTAAQELDGKNAHIRALKAAVLLRLNDRAGAKAEAQEALALDPSNASAVVVLAAERMAAGDAEGALVILERTSAVDEKDLGIQLFKAMLFQQLGQHAKLDQMLRRLVELYPQEASFRRQLIGSYLGQKRPQDAEKELRALVSANNNALDVGMDLVRLVNQINGADAARRELVLLAEAGKNGFEYRLALADFDLRSGRGKQAIEQLEQLIKSNLTQAQFVTAEVKRAEFLLRQNQVAAAEAAVANALNKDARNVAGLRVRALLRLEKGQLEEAISDARQALNDQPRSAELMLLLAAVYERNGSIELAEKQFSDAVRAADDPAALLGYAAFLRRRGNVERAEEVLSGSVNRWPKSVPVLSALAEIRLERKNWVGAQAIAERIRELGDNIGLSEQIMGVAFTGRGRSDDSIAAFESAVAASPAAMEPLFNLVSALIRTKNYDRATSLLENVLRSNPANAEAHVLMASLLLAKGAPDQALQRLRLAIERQPNGMAGYLGLSNFYIRQNKLDEAEKALRDGLEQAPDNLAGRMALASMLETKGRNDEALVEFEHLLKLQPGSLLLANNVASLLADYRQDKESLDRAFSLASMLRKSPVPAFKDTLGWVYYRRGDHRGALPLLEEAAAALPNEVLVQYHLGMCYAALGQPAKASEQFKKALALSPQETIRERIELAAKKLEL
jgi:tetratricopeptide (TPR) repeat protein